MVKLKNRNQFKKIDILFMYLMQICAKNKTNRVDKKKLSYTRLIMVVYVYFIMVQKLPKTKQEPQPLLKCYNHMETQI